MGSAWLATLEAIFLPKILVLLWHLILSGRFGSILIFMPILVFWFLQTNLFDQHFTYDLNLSGVGCHCNAAGYFIKMPAQVPGGGGDYYCDANYVGGIGWASLAFMRGVNFLCRCPEYDTLESNKYIVTGALHNCGWDGNWFSDCDMGGCGSSSWYTGGYCPGGGYLKTTFIYF